MELTEFYRIYLDHTTQRLDLLNAPPVTRPDNIDKHFVTRLLNHAACAEVAAGLESGDVGAARKVFSNPKSPVYNVKDVRGVVHEQYTNAVSLAVCLRDVEALKLFLPHTNEHELTEVGLSLTHFVLSPWYNGLGKEKFDNDMGPMEFTAGSLAVMSEMVDILKENGFNLQFSSFATSPNTEYLNPVLQEAGHRNVVPHSFTLPFQKMMISKGADPFKMCASSSVSSYTVQRAVIDGDIDEFVFYHQFVQSLQLNFAGYSRVMGLETFLCPMPGTFASVRDTQFGKMVAALLNSGMVTNKAMSEASIRSVLGEVIPSLFVDPRDADIADVDTGVGQEYVMLLGAGGVGAGEDIQDAMLLGEGGGGADVGEA